MLQRWIQFADGWFGWRGIILIALMAGLLAFLVGLIAEPGRPIGHHAILAAVMALAQVGIGAAIKGSFGDNGRKRD